MKITTSIFFSESDIAKMVKDNLRKRGYEVHEIKIIAQSKKDIPQGATAGDCVGITVTVTKK